MDGLFAIFDAIGDFLESVAEVPQRIGEMANGLVEIGEGISQEFVAVPEAITYTAKDIFLFGFYTLKFSGELLYCTMKILFNFPSCFIWYLIEIIGIILYLPIRFVFWIFGLGSIEDAIWSALYEADKWVYLNTGGHKDNENCSGYHFLHYPCWILEKCYRCRDDAGNELANRTVYANNMTEIRKDFGNIYRLFTDPINLMEQGGMDFLKGFTG